MGHRVIDPASVEPREQIPLAYHSREETEARSASETRVARSDAPRAVERRSHETTVTPLLLGAPPVDAHAGAPPVDDVHAYDPAA